MESYRGLIITPTDAIILLEASRKKLVPRITRRLSDYERINTIVSGAVFIWNESDSRIRRWTDGKNWSASRVNGSFLIYKEMEHNQMNNKSFNYKTNGLIKQSFSVTLTTGDKFHLISYINSDYSNKEGLTRPSTDNRFKDLFIEKSLYPENTLNDSQPATLEVTSTTGSPSSPATPTDNMPSPKISVSPTSATKRSSGSQQSVTKRSRVNSPSLYSYSIPISASLDTSSSKVLLSSSPTLSQLPLPPPIIPCNIPSSHQQQQQQQQRATPTYSHFSNTLPSVELSSAPRCTIPQISILQCRSPNSVQLQLSSQSQNLNTQSIASGGVSPHSSYSSMVDETSTLYSRSRSLSNSTQVTTTLSASSLYGSPTDMRSLKPYSEILGNSNILVLPSISNYNEGNFHVSKLYYGGLIKEDGKVLNFLDRSFK